jgi:hypothetical protein
MPGGAMGRLYAAVPADQYFGPGLVRRRTSHEASALGRRVGLGGVTLSTARGAELERGRILDRAGKDRVAPAPPNRDRA